MPAAQKCLEGLWHIFIYEQVQFFFEELGGKIEAMFYHKTQMLISARQKLKSWLFAFCLLSKELHGREMQQQFDRKYRFDQLSAPCICPLPWG